MSRLFSFTKSKQFIIISTAFVGAVGASALKEYMQGEKLDKKFTANDKIAIVTGASGGIGLETARELAKRGARVYMACRDMKKCEKVRREIVLQTSNKYVYCRECDLSSMESIREFAKKFKEEQQRLDILINNAGVMRCPRLLTKEGIEMQLGVNHIGHFLLTNLLLDLLKQSAPSRIVVLSSIAHSRGQMNTADLNSDKQYDPSNAYNQSKLANVLFTRELSKQLEGTGVVVNAVHPGLVDTDIIRHMGIFNSFSGSFVKMLVWPFIKTPIYGAQSTLYAALHPDFENQSGYYISEMKKTDVSEAAKDDEMARWLWKVSEKWTRLEK